MTTCTVCGAETTHEDIIDTDTGISYCAGSCEGVAVDSKLEVESDEDAE